MDVPFYVTRIKRYLVFRSWSLAMAISDPNRSGENAKWKTLAQN
jgi:hypothetical protein